MTNEDFEQLRSVGRHLAGMLRIGVVAPVPKRRRRPPWRTVARSELRVFPGATALPRHRWDLNDPGTEEFDLVVASNVLMYSAEPALWFGNVFAACECFLLIDLVRRRRRKDSELGGDADCMRYAIGGERPRVDRSFDLDELGDRVLGFRTYYGGANAYDDDPLHFIAVLRGDLSLTSDPHEHRLEVQAAVRELDRR